MTDSYDHNQTVVPEAFLAIYIQRERLTVDRAELEARCDFCESLAVQATVRLPQVAGDDGAAQQQVLQRTLEALTGEPAQVSRAEAIWIVGRIAELQDWAAPAWAQAAAAPP